MALIDFSKKMEGRKLITGGLPFEPGNAKKNTEELFSILGKYYLDKKMLAEVKSYLVFVLPQDGSYVLTLCDKQSKNILYKDLGSTITVIDYPYWREKIEVPCK